MPVEHDLGPLWEGPPKTDGFRVSIPAPGELSQWIQETSSRFGDLAQEQIDYEIRMQRDRAQRGESYRHSPYQRIWEVGIADGILDLIYVELSAGYSIKDGEWGEIVCEIDSSEQESIQWMIPARSADIAEKLQDKELTVLPETDSDGAQNLIIPNTSNDVTAIIDLGFASADEAARAELDWGIHFVLLKFSNSIPVSVQNSNKHLQHLQLVASHTIDAIYQSLDAEPPDVIFELSEQNELR